MAGTVRTGDYLPQQGDWRTVNPQDYYPNFPDIPQGYDNWNQYVLDVIDANARGEEGPRPYNVYGGDAIGDPSMSPRAWLQHSLGYGQLVPFLDQSDPKIQQLLDNMYYAGTSHDSPSIWGDQFAQALMGLGAFVGGSAALGAFAPAAGASGGALGAGELGLETTFPLASGTAASAAPEVAGGAGAAALAGGAAGDLVAPVGYLGATVPAAGGVAPAALGAAVPASAGGLLGAVAPYAAIAGPVVSAGSTLLGGLLAGNAAKAAADTQARAADRANQTLLDVYGQQRADMLPYLGAGYAALGQLSSLADQPLSYGPYTATPTLDPSGYAFNPDAYAFTAPNAPLNPQDHTFTAPSGQQVLNDPGYQFRLNEGLKALQATQAAKGGLLSGGAVKGALQYGQNLASQEYGNVYNRAFQANQFNTDLAKYANETTYNRGLAQNQLGYERGLQANQLGYGRAYQQNADEAARTLGAYTTNLNAQMGLRNQQTDLLGRLAGLGSNATSQQAGLSATLGSQLANNITGAGAAQAAGQVGASNALTQGLAGVGNAANSYLQAQLLQSLLQRR